jgi:tetratricopeptide (TPR) repeat protein
MSSAEILALCRTATERIAAGDALSAAHLLAEPLARAPRDPNLLYVAGNCALAGGDETAALEYYERSVAVAPTFVAALANLGFVLRIRARLDEARELLRRAVVIDPANSTAWMNLVSCYVNEGDPLTGEAIAREALVLHPRDPVIRWNLALVLLEQGRWREGWQEHLHRFDTPAVSRPASAAGLTRLPHPRHLVPGDTVLCHGEQGLGDELLFAGMLAEFLEDADRRGASVILQSNPRLAGIFARNFAIRQRDEPGPSPNRTGEPPSRWFVPIGDLPAFYRNADDEFPKRQAYLVADRAAAERIRERLVAGHPDRPLVGIAWKGGSTYTHASHRTIPLADWLPILRHDARFVSLAYHDAAPEIAALRSEHGIDVIDMSEATRAADYERTLELVSALDLVIAVPTSVHHVAGSVGTPCWLMMDERAAWRECSRDASLPWYPGTHRRYVRQRTACGWGGVIATVAQALAAWLRVPGLGRTGG